MIRTKQKVFNLKQLEEYYSNCKKIRLATDKKLTVEEIYDNLIMDRNSTYYSRLGNHCKPNKMRSLDDFIKVCKFYNSELTVKEIIQKLINYEKHRIKHNKLIKWLAYCPDIKKLNFRLSNLSENNYKQKLTQCGFRYLNKNVIDIINED